MRTAIPSFGGSAKTPWNRGRLIGQKRPLRPKEVWAIRVRLQLEGRKRDLALFKTDPRTTKPLGAASVPSSTTSPRRNAPMISPMPDRLQPNRIML